MKRMLRNGLWTVLLPLVACSARAAIVYVDIPDADEGFLHFPQEGPEVRERAFDVNNDGFTDLTFRTTRFTFGVVPGPNTQLISTGPEGLAPLEFGTLIGMVPPSGYLWSGIGQSIAYGFNDGLVAGGPWYGVGEKYIGFRFQTGGDEHFGWMRMYDIAEVGGLFRDYAYSTEAGEAVTAGSVPEPTTALLLCVGFAVSVMERRASSRRPKNKPRSGNFLRTVR